LVNNKNQWVDFTDYIDFIIGQQHKVLEQSSDIIIIHQAQGAISTLRRLKLLRDEVNG
tara:strand:+ start:200 stop:373 length:174 start_codon:yes stop_codon:yes gene_type:complete